MPVNYDPDDERFESDIDSIGKFAKTEPQRRAALDACLNGAWANQKIGCLERVENSKRWGWRMYPYRAGETGPPDV